MIPAKLTEGESSLKAKRGVSPGGATVVKVKDFTSSLKFPLVSLDLAK